MEHTEHLDTKQILKQNLRGLVYNQDPVLRYNLMTGTQILHSTEYPTQVFRLKGTKYLRINSADIEALPDEEALNDLIKLMLSMDDYSSHDGDETPPTLEDQTIDAVELYQSFTGEDLRESEIIEADALGNITDISKLPIQQKVFKAKSTPEEDKEDSSGDDMTKDASDMAKATGLTEDPGAGGAKPEPVAYQMEIKEVEQSLEDVKHYKSKSRFSADQSILSAPELVVLNSTVKKLLKAFKGHNSKQKRITPRKLISAKSMAMDAEKIYIDKKAPVGKHINFNLLIDMSGSMSGDPMKNAVSLIYLFNKLAQQGYVTGSVLYSSDECHYVRQFPMSDPEVLSIHRTRGSEGLAETVDANVDTLRNVNCICITDGNIVDRPIDKMFWRKHKIVSTGVYINPQMENPLEYTGQLEKWFDHSLVRASLDDMIQLLIKLGLKG